MSTHARLRGVPLETVVQWMCSGPARMLGLEGSKGSLTAGRDADLVIFDQSADMTIVPRMIQHRHKLTPYEGLTFKGTVLKTIVRGRVVFDGAVVTEHPSGVPLLKGQRPCELRK